MKTPFSSNPSAPEFDPGLSQKIDGKLRRSIERDGTFNVRRFGERFEGLHLYQFLVTCSWPRFLGLVALTYVVVNALFALLYLSVGVQRLQGIPEGGAFSQFLYAFFFSAQTFTSVGYGVIAPKDIPTGLISSFEALVGLMGLALATGLLFARFSRPTARILFSSRAVIAPYLDKTGLMFRVVNARANILIDLDAKVIIGWVEQLNGKPVRRFRNVNLERPGVYMFPLTWTVVHPIDEQSPLWGLSNEEMNNRQVEVMILMKGYDDSFSQSVHARSSYISSEIAFGHKFIPIFHVSEDGTVLVNVDRLDETEEVKDMIIPMMTNP